MKKIAIVLFASIALTSCGGDSSKCENENCADTCKVATVVSAPTDSTNTVDTTASVK